MMSQLKRDTIGLSLIYIMVSEVVGHTALSMRYCIFKTVIATNGLGRLLHKCQLGT